MPQVVQSQADVDRCWQSFLRRFDLDHTFRLFKQTLGWNKPRLRSPEPAGRWTWLVIAAYAQLQLARALATDLRRPWKKPALPNKLSPARVRRGFRNLRTKAGSPARAPKPSRPGPGRPPGSKNSRPAIRHDVGRVLATGEAYRRPTLQRHRAAGAIDLLVWATAVHHGHTVLHVDNDFATVAAVLKEVQQRDVRT